MSINSLNHFDSVRFQNTVEILLSFACVLLKKIAFSFTTQIVVILKTYILKSM